jgi:D-3-phosphoglycerate dehydrogenase / 2-oxoglutarate reductase
VYRIWFERPVPSDLRALLPPGSLGLGAWQEGSAPDAELAAAQAVIASSRLSYDAAFMDRAPELAVIARTGIGCDSIDLNAASRRGIAVCNTPDAPTASVAEHALMLMLAIAKRLKPAERAVAEGRVDVHVPQHEGVELAGARLGLVGLGRSGGYLARLASALGMRVAACDPGVPDQRFAELGVKQVGGIDALVADADVVSLHVPLTLETHHLIDRAVLDRIRPGAILINTARGGLVDEQALLDALEQGRLAGAGLDVTDPEPPAVDSPLLSRDDVIVTPHVATATRACRTRLYESALSQAVQVLRGVRPPHLVNPEVWDHRQPVLEPR